jgi:hypothetical protein
MNHTNKKKSITTNASSNVPGNNGAGDARSHSTIRGTTVHQQARGLFLYNNNTQRLLIKKNINLFLKLRDHEGMLRRDGVGDEVDVVGLEGVGCLFDGVLEEGGGVF